MDPERRKTSSLVLLNNGFCFMSNFLKRKRQRKRRTCWVNRRNSLSAYQTILSELRLNNAEYFRRYLRMNTEWCRRGKTIFSTLLSLLLSLLLLLLLLLLNTLLTNFWQVKKSITNQWIRSQIFYFLLTNVRKHYS